MENLATALAGLGPQEGQQVGVELLLVRAGEAVGRARIDLKARVLDELRGEEGRVVDRHNLVVVAMDDQGRNVELLEVFREVRLGEGLDAVECAFEADLHRPQPERVQHALGHLGTRPVGAEEGIRNSSGKSAGLGTNLAEKYSHSTEMYRILFLEHW